MTEKMNLQILMSKLGYGSGFRLPVANEENQKLEKALEEQQRRLLEIRGQADDERKQLEHLREYMHRTTTNISLQEKMLQTKKSTINVEEGVAIRKRTAVNNLKTELADIKQKCVESKSKNNTNVQQLEKRKEWCEKKRQKDAKCKAAVDAFRDAINDKEKDTEFILRLMNIDDKTIHDFEFKFLKLGNELAASKKELNRVVEFTNALNLQFDRAVKQFRQVYKERNQGVDLWKGTLETLKYRDNAIKKLAKKFRVVYKEIRQKCNEVEKKQQILEFSISETHEVTFKITLVEKNVDKIRLEIIEGNKLQSGLSTEITGIQHLINKSSVSFKLLNDKIILVDKETETMESRTAAAENEVKSMRVQLNSGKDGETSLPQRLRSMEKLVDEEESKTEVLRKTLEKIRAFRWSRQNDVLIMKEELHQLEYKMKSAKSLLKNMRHHAVVYELTVEKKRHTFFELQLKLLTIERRYKEMTEPPEFDLMSEATNALKRCKKELEDCVKDKAFLLNQKGHMEDCNRRIRKEVTDNMTERIDLIAMIKYRRLMITTGKTEIEESEKALRDMKIECSLVLLTQRRLAKIINEQKETTCTLEQDRLHLQAAIKQRKSEIEIHLKLLKVKLRTVRDERAQIIFQKNQIQAEIAKRKNNYEILASTMTSSEEKEKRGEFTEAYYILKHAQEKETVKREGDLWDSRVKEAEKETTALQNTIAVMKSANNAFKESLTPALVGTQDLEHIKMLEHQLIEATIRKRNANKKLRDITKECYEMESEITQLNIGMDTLKGVVSDKQYQLNVVVSEIKKQKEKIARAVNVVSRIEKSFKNQTASEKNLIEAELKTKFTRKKFDYALKMLDRAISQHPEMKVPVLEFFSQKPKLHHFAKHLEKSGKCISVDASQPSTPKTAQSHKFSSQKSLDAEYVRNEHRYLKHIPSVYEMHKSNVESGVTNSGNRRILHDELVGKLGEKPDEKLGKFKEIIRRKSVKDKMAALPKTPSKTLGDKSHSSSSTSSAKSSGPKRLPSADSVKL